MAVENILAAYAAIWRAPLGEANPNENSIGFGVAWGGNWVYLGDTLTPLTVGVDEEVKQVEIQQAEAPVKEFRVKKAFALKTSLAEHDSGIYNLLHDGNVTTTAAGASQVGIDKLNFGGETDVAQYKWGFEIPYVDASGNQLFWRYIFYKGSIRQDGDLTFDRKNEGGIPIVITILSDNSRTVGDQTGEIQFVTAPATS